MDEERTSGRYMSLTKLFTGFYIISGENSSNIFIMSSVKLSFWSLTARD